jgi:hypothetical protein
VTDGSAGSLEDFDAVVFHIRDMDGGKIAMPNQKRRKPHQRYVMFLMESPLNDNFPYENFGNFFNWQVHYKPIFLEPCISSYSCGRLFSCEVPL